MAPYNAFNQYKQNSVYTSTPEELTLMLYNGLVKFIMQSQTSVAESNIEKAYNLLVRAQDIILYFRATLDMKYEVSKGLDALYEYMYRRLVEANVRKDGVIIAEVLGIARELRDTWIEAMKIAKQPHKAEQQSQSAMNQ